MQPGCGHSPHCSTFFRGICHSPRPWLLAALSKLSSLSLGSLSSKLLSSSFLHCLFSMLLHLRVARPVLRPFLHLLLTSSKVFFASHPLQHIAVGFVILFNITFSSFRPGDHTANKLLVLFVPPLLFILLLHFMQPVVRSLHCIRAFWMKPRFFLQSPVSISSTHQLLFACILSFAFDLTGHICHGFHSMLLRSFFFCVTCLLHASASLQAMNKFSPSSLQPIFAAELSKLFLTIRHSNGPLRPL